MNRRTALSLLVALPLAGLTAVTASGYAELPMSDRERFERAWAAGHPSTDEEWWYVVNSLPDIMESKLTRSSILDRWLLKSARWHESEEVRAIKTLPDFREVGWLIDVGSALRDACKGTPDYEIALDRLKTLGTHLNYWTHIGWLASE